MKPSPVKFDDLAFILLFFFMIMAVVSFSDSAKKDVSSSESQETENVAVFLNSDGSIIKDGQTVDFSVFTESDSVDLSCSADCSWSLISKTISEFNSCAQSVFLVIE